MMKYLTLLSILISTSLGQNIVRFQINQETPDGVSPASNTDILVGKNGSMSKEVTNSEGFAEINLGSLSKNTSLKIVWLKHPTKTGAERLIFERDFSVEDFSQIENKVITFLWTYKIESQEVVLESDEAPKEKIQDEQDLEILPGPYKIIFQFNKMDKNENIIGSFKNEPIRVLMDGEEYQDFTTDLNGEIHFQIQKPSTPLLQFIWLKATSCNGTKTLMNHPVKTSDLVGNKVGIKLFANYWKELFQTNQIRFATGSYQIVESPETQDALDDLWTFIFTSQKDFPCKDIEIHGHTDSDGSDDKNQTLSENRAQEVIKWLKKHPTITLNGKKETIDTNALKARGFGESLPISDNKTKAGKAKNRRVEAILVEKN